MRLLACLLCLLCILTIVPTARAAPVVMNVGDEVSIGGQLYRVGAVLVAEVAAPIVTPAPAPSPAPTPIVNPAPAVKLQVTEIRDGARNPVPSSALLPAGSTFYIDGAGFGDTAGTLTYAAALPLVVIKWTDTEIQATVPATGFPTSNTLLVTRPDGVFSLSTAFGVAPPP